VTALTRIQGMCTVRVIEADTEAPKPFLVTEYADGPSLSEYVDAYGPLDAWMLYGLATGLAEALTAIHAAGIVHRDLKPSNVLLTPGGPKVIDFGIAQALDTASLTRTGITVGSAGYIAPEQITGRAGTPADIFTWAVTVAFAASGQSPFGSGTSEAMLWRIMNQAPDIAAVPPGLRPLVEAALAKDPQARPTAPQLLAELTNSQRTGPGYDSPTETVLAQTWHPSATGPMGPAPVPTGPGGPRPSRRRKALIPVVLTLAFLLAAGGTALGLALAGKPASPAASGSTTAPASTPAQPSSSAATTPTSPAASTTSPASTPASTPPTTPVSTPASTTPAALPVLTVGSYTGMKPTEIAYSGDATNVVTKITWSSWTSSLASGQGTSDIDSCNPNCAQAPPSLVPTTVTLSAPVNGRFTKMTETRNGFTSTYTYPDNWPQSAS